MAKISPDDAAPACGSSESAEECKRAVAIHELGHALVAHYLGGAVKRVSIDLGDSGGWKGQVAVTDLGILARGAYILAGRIAEEMNETSPLDALYRVQQDEKDFEHHASTDLELKGEDANIHYEMCLAVVEKALRAYLPDGTWNELLEKLLSKKVLEQKDFDTLHVCGSMTPPTTMDDDSDEETEGRQLMEQILDNMEPS